MSKYEKKGTITFSPTAITDKEEVHEFHKRVKSGCECNAASGSVDILYIAYTQDPESGAYRFIHIPDGIYKTLYEHLHDYKPVCVYIMYHYSFGEKPCTIYMVHRYSDEGEYICMYIGDKQNIVACFYPDGRAKIEYWD